MTDQSAQCESRDVANVAEAEHPVKSGTRLDPGRLPYDCDLNWSESPAFEEYYTRDQGKRKWLSAAWLIVAVACLTAAAVIIGFVVAGPGQAPALSVGVIVGLIVVACATMMIVAFQYAAARRHFYDRVRLIKAKQVDLAIEEVRQGPLLLADLFTLNRRQLDEYHVLSVRQASIAFRNAEIASSLAFVILVAGAIVALNQTDSSGQYVAAGLAGLGTALSAFISRVFFKSYKETKEQLRDYYEEPSLTNRYLNAERLARNASSGKGSDQTISEELLEEIVAAILAPPRRDGTPSPKASIEPA